jgi:hypothetical protein
MKSKKVHDPFHDNEPQVPAHVLPPEPPELRPLDEAHGGLPTKHRVLTDEGFEHAYVQPPADKLPPDFRKGKK